jgi:hypothetical protein
MLQLIPAVEVWPWEVPTGWAPSVNSQVWIELHGSTPLVDVARVVARVASYGHDMPDSAKDAANLIIVDHCCAVAGGLIARKDALELEPGCCCGLESWRDWIGLRPGSPSVWLGHDPDQGVDCGPDAAVIGREGRYPVQIAVDYDELAKAVAGAESDLRAFLDRLRDWAGDVGVPPDELAAGFARTFKIGS